MFHATSHLDLILFSDPDKDTPENYDNFFDRPISKEEVLRAMRRIKDNKAAGPDMIIGELIKHSFSTVVELLHQFLNELFNKVLFPDKCTESIIITIFKKGDRNNPNCRGISLRDATSKGCGFIINSRLQEWMDEKQIVWEYQARFRKGYSTVNDMFTLMGLIPKQFSLNRKPYVAFIEFEFIDLIFDFRRQSSVLSIMMPSRWSTITNI